MMKYRWTWMLMASMLLLATSWSVADDPSGGGEGGDKPGGAGEVGKKLDPADVRQVLDQTLIRILGKRNAPEQKKGLWEELVNQPYHTPLQKAQKLLFHGQYLKAEKQFDLVLATKLSPMERQLAWEGKLEAVLLQDKQVDLDRFHKLIANPPAATETAGGTTTTAPSATQPGEEPSTGSVNLLRLQAMALVRTGKLNEARLLLQPLVALKLTLQMPNPAGTLAALNLYGQILETQANYTAATALYEQIGQLALHDLPDDPALRTEIAHALYRSGILTAVGGNRHREVLLRLTRINEDIDRTYWPAHLEAAQLLLASHNDREGGQEVEATLGLNPNSFEAHTLALDWAIENYNFERAQAELDTLKKNSDSPRVNALEGRLLLKQRLPEQAVAPLKQAVTRNPMDPEARGWLAGAYYLLCQNELAQEQLGALQTADAPTTQGAHPGATVGGGGAKVGGHPVVLYQAAEILRDARQFTQAETLYLEAAQAAAWWSEPYAALAQLYLETGQEEKAQLAYDKSFKIDPFNNRAYNQLTLLDYLNNKEQFRLLETDHFIIRYDKRDAILAKLASVQLERIYPDVTGYFGVTRLPTKTQIEFFPSHEQFGVRTTGLPWIGTVGACTGNVIAMDVPRGDGGAKDLMGAFDWARVLRHEYTHTVTLALTNNRIPHWLTEAAACDQEQAPRDWDHCQLLGSNYRAGTLFKLKDLNWGFIRPKRSIDRLLAYMQSQWIYEYLIETYGQPKMLGFMAAFRDGKTEPQALQQVYGKTQEQLDTEFLAWAGKQIESWGLPSDPLPQRSAVEKAVKDDPKNADAKVTLAWVLLNGGNPKEVARAESLLREAITLNPKHAGARELLGAILKTNKKTAEARILLEGLVQDDPRRPVAWRTLGLMAMSEKRFADAEQAFLQLQQLRPLEDTSYQNLAGIYLVRKNLPAAIAQLMELQAHEQHDERIPRKLAELILATSGNLREAETMAYKAIRINPYNAINHELLASILMAEKQPARAAEFYRYATELQPRLAIYWAGLAEALGEARDQAGAAAAAQQAVKLQPDSPAAKWLAP